MLSQHSLEGMLEGYLLTGRHGLLSSYGAFIHVIDRQLVEVRIKSRKRASRVVNKAPENPRSDL